MAIKASKITVEVRVPHVVDMYRPNIKYIIISIAHSMPEDSYIKMWGPNCCGYRGRIETAGRYSARTVNEALHYYNDGVNTIAVPEIDVKSLVVPADLHFFDEDGIGPGHWLKNDKNTWCSLLQNAASINRNIEELYFYHSR